MTNILIIIDPDEVEHTALSRVKELPPNADINYKVDLYLNVQHVDVKDESSRIGAIKQYIQQKKDWLEELVAPFKALGYRIETDLLTIDRLYEDIIKSAKAFKADFVFKPLRQHRTLRRAFYTSTDWNLIRLCPAPLLLVSDQSDIHGRPIIAAVAAGETDPAHEKLNEVVVEQSNLLSRVLDAKVHLVSAYGPAAVTSQIAVGDPLAYQVIRGKYDEILTAAHKLGRDHGLDDESVHLREGAADIVLQEVSEELGAGVIVVGTVARSGASGLFIGNTAESVLERTSRDVFVVKGPEFKAPI